MDPIEAVGLYRLSPRAQADVDQIWDQTAERWGVDQAERYVRLIQIAIQGLADHPTKSRECDHIRVGYRRQNVASHVLFYRIVDDAVEIIRILHGRMDFERHLRW